MLCQPNLYFIKVKSPIIFSVVLLLLGCQSSTSPEFGLVDWYIANGGGSSITLTIYDKVCGEITIVFELPGYQKLPFQLVPTRREMLKFDSVEQLVTVFRQTLYAMM